MKRLFALLFIVASVSACSTSLKNNRRLASDLSEAQRSETEMIHRDINAYISAAEESYAWRAAAIKLFKVYKSKNVLSSADLGFIYEQSEYYLEIRQRLLTMIEKYQNDIFSLERKLDFTNTDDLLYMKKTKLALSAGLVLYDNYVIGIYPYYADKRLRRLLRRDKPELEGKLDDLMKSFLSEKNRDRLAYGIMVYSEQTASKYQPLDSDDTYLNAAVAQSPSFDDLKKDADEGIHSGKVRYGFNRVRDGLKVLGRAFTFGTSKFFGNTVGLVETREGYLKGLPSVEKKTIKASMQPLDVLMEKTPFRLTDKFIPGHYGHVAVWVGTEDELKKLGIWENEHVRKYHSLIKTGHHIIEALRPGVEINTLEHFLNIDDLLVVRDTNLTDERRARYLINAFAQVGKDYDFNFDVETDKRIVCSELAYVVYDDMTWPTEKSLGRATISPDNVAVKSTSKNPFTPVIMYHEGKRIEIDQQEELLRKLLSQ